MEAECFLLSEASYLNKIKATIENTVSEFENDETVNLILLWEMVKLKVRERSISYAAQKKSERMNREEDLVKSIAILEKQLDNGNSSANLQARMLWKNLTP